MKPTLSFFGLPFGISALFWLTAGLLRSITEHIQQLTPKKNAKTKFGPADVAAIIPAHNEEIGIHDSIAALARVMPVKNIHVVSDGSIDKTARIASKTGCKVIELIPGRGKAKAIIETINRFDLFDNYKFIFIVDADTRIDRNFLKKGLPMFNDPDIGVLFGNVQIKWPAHIIPRLSLYFVAYRERLNRILQIFFTYGQTWKYTNTTYVIPGFATLWRSNILHETPIDTPGLLVEDFNTAFYVHKHHVCKIGYNPQCIGWDQHPESLKDYITQVRRWNIAFFQTVKKNGIWLSWYWLSLGLFTLEVFVNSFFTLVLPFLIIYLLIKDVPFLPPILSMYKTFYQHLNLFTRMPLVDILMLFFVFDYGMTVIIGLVYKKPQFLFYGIFFFVMHFITSVILFSSLIPGFFTTSAGRWNSPKRSTMQLSVKV